MNDDNITSIGDINATITLLQEIIQRDQAEIATLTSREQSLREQLNILSTSGQLATQATYNAMSDLPIADVNIYDAASSAAAIVVATADTRAANEIQAGAQGARKALSAWERDLKILNNSHAEAQAWLRSHPAHAAAAAVHSELAGIRAHNDGLADQLQSAREEAAVASAALAGARGRAATVPSLGPEIAAMAARCAALEGVLRTELANVRTKEQLQEAVKEAEQELEQARLELTAEREELLLMQNR